MGAPLNARRFDSDSWSPAVGDDSMDGMASQWGGNSGQSPVYQPMSHPSMNQVGQQSESIPVPQPATVPIPPEALLLPEDYGQRQPGATANGGVPLVSAPPTSGGPAPSGGAPISGAPVSSVPISSVPISATPVSGMPPSNAPASGLPNSGASTAGPYDRSDPKPLSRTEERGDRLRGVRRAEVSSADPRLQPQPTTGMSHPSEIPVGGDAVTGDTGGRAWRENPPWADRRSDTALPMDGAYPVVDPSSLGAAGQPNGTGRGQLPPLQATRAWRTVEQEAERPPADPRSPYSQFSGVPQPPQQPSAPQPTSPASGVYQQPASPASGVPYHQPTSPASGVPYQQPASPASGVPYQHQAPTTSSFSAADYSPYQRQRPIPYPQAPHVDQQAYPYSHQSPAARATERPTEIEDPRPRIRPVSSAPAASTLPRRVPGRTDVPGALSAPREPDDQADADLDRIVDHLSNFQGEAPRREDVKGFDIPSVVNAVRGVDGVRDAHVISSPSGAHTLRLDLVDEADAAEISRVVARLLQEKMGLAAEPNRPQPRSRRAGQLSAATAGSQHRDTKRRQGAGIPPQPVSSAPATSAESQGSSPHSGMRLDPTSSPAPRALIGNVKVTDGGLDTAVEVELSVGERVTVGTASGPAFDGFVLRLLAAATASAVDQLLSQGGNQRARCFVEHATVVSFGGGCDVAVVVVLLAGDGWVDHLTGSALVSGDMRHAVVRATMSALNRRLEALL